VPLTAQAHALPAFRFAVILSARVTRAPGRAPLLAASRVQPIQLPTLLVYGGADTDVPAAMTRELRDTFDPSCVTEVFLPGWGWGWGWG
jgi:pimeloyl-ACP methyl ester carboxylesterase